MIFVTDIHLPQKLNCFIGSVTQKSQISITGYISQCLHQEVLLTYLRNLVIEGNIGIIYSFHLHIAPGRKKTHKYKIKLYRIHLKMVNTV